MPAHLKKIRRRHYVILILLVTIYLCGTTCTGSHNEAAAALRDSYGQAYAGETVCLTCHKEIYNTHIQTAHYRDSRPASTATIRGSFDSGRNRFSYHPGLDVLMQKKDSGYFQTAFRDGRQFRSESFSIVIGSGRKGQSYLYWKDEKLYQLPISWFTPTDSWCNSPGYTADSPLYDRRIPASCLECHMTNARTVFSSSKEYGDFFDSSQIIYGIGCEKCHGPGAQHVAFHSTHPGEKTGRYILNTGTMTRQQKLDACALCHSGSRYPLKPAFSFRAGDRLNDFSQAKYHPENASTLDVHGNQYGLLTSSQCFIQSRMDCSTCHNVHVNEAGSLKSFSQRCISCHNGNGHPDCKMPATEGLVLRDNCIDCHMPALSSQKIVLELSNLSDTGRTISNRVRTHHIAVYPDYTRTYLNKLRAAGVTPTAPPTP